MDKSTKRVLITGGAGFIGAHVISYLLEKTNWEIICLDRYDIAGNINRVAEVVPEDQKHRIKVVFHDLKASINEFTTRVIGEVDHIIHLAAASHVDRSIKNPISFMMDNTVGSTNILLWAKDGGMKRTYKSPLPTTKEVKYKEDFEWSGKFINFSTDEVFGAAEIGHDHEEDEPHKPSNPYSASKSGQEAIGSAFYTTYGLPVVTIHAMNNFGERQHPEKFIPCVIRKVLEGKEMPVYVQLDKNGKPELAGSRYWIHCRDTASAILFLLENGVSGEKYNVVGTHEFTNLEMAEKIAKIIDKPLIPNFIDIRTVRPGHDKRYSLSGEKMKKMGWVPSVDFEQALINVVKFTMDNPQWQ